MLHCGDSSRDSSSSSAGGGGSVRCSGCGSGGILRVLHVIHSGGKSSSGDGCGTLVQ